MKGSSRKADLVDIVIYIKRIGRYMEGECNGESKK